jgi:hypothetical protein
LLPQINTIDIKAFDLFGLRLKQKFDFIVVDKESVQCFVFAFSFILTKDYGVRAVEVEDKQVDYVVDLNLQS